MARSATVWTAWPGAISYVEFLDGPGENRHVEWVNGEVIELPPVTAERNRIGRFLVVILNTYIENNRSGALFYEPFQMKTGPGLPGRSPDVMFLAREHLFRQNRVTGPEHGAYVVNAPDIIQDHGERKARFVFHLFNGRLAGLNLLVADLFDTLRHSTSWISGEPVRAFRGIPVR